MSSFIWLEKQKNRTYGTILLDLSHSYNIFEVFSVFLLVLYCCWTVGWSRVLFLLELGFPHDVQSLKPGQTSLLNFYWLSLHAHVIGL